jgi:hypothetical protein
VRRRARNLSLDLVLGLLRVALTLLSRVVPTGPSVVVAGFPETEGNAVETARALLARYDGDVVWLRESGRTAPEVEELAAAGMRVVRKASARGLAAYLRAEAVVFTHGLYGNPAPAARKPIVNLWHGDGPKDVTPGRGVGASIRSTWMVGSTELWAERRAAGFGVDRDHVLLVGNARTDQLWRPTPAEGLAALGVTGDFAVWLPTFRRPRPVGAVRVVDGPRPSERAAERAVRERLVAALADRGMQLVVKPHPMDADRRAWDGCVRVDEESLAGASTTLYSLLGAARALVTDYSSVWVDFLLTDRPMAFVVADRHDYDRELYPADVLDWVPGEIVDPDADPFADFLADLDERGALGHEQRREVAERIGLVYSRTVADDLVGRLLELGVLGRSRSARGRRNGRSSSR